MKSLALLADAHEERLLNLYSCSVTNTRITCIPDMLPKGNLAYNFSPNSHPLSIHPARLHDFPRSMGLYIVNSHYGQESSYEQTQKLSAFGGTSTNVSVMHLLITIQPICGWKFPSSFLD